MSGRSTPRSARLVDLANELQLRLICNEPWPGAPRFAEVVAAQDWAAGDYELGRPRNRLRCSTCRCLGTWPGMVLRIRGIDLRSPAPSVRRTGGRNADSQPAACSLSRLQSGRHPAPAPRRPRRRHPGDAGRKRCRRLCRHRASSAIRCRLQGKATVTPQETAMSTLVSTVASVALTLSPTGRAAACMRAFSLR